MLPITKYRVPILGKEIVPRPKLLDLLDEVSQTGLAVVCAPAGYGKSTLASMWLKQRRLSHCWLSLDERDNDEMHFWRDLQTCMANVSERFTSRITENQIQDNSLGILSRVDALCHQLIEYGRTWDAPEQLILVLDDFHIIKNPEIHKQLSLFINYSPAFFKLIVISRFEPHLNLSNRRVKGCVTELNSHHLTLNIEESGAFLQSQQGIELDSENLEALHKKTEGWAAALQLAGMALKQKSDKSKFIATFSGNQSLLSSYLFEEVFCIQAPEFRRTLISIAILPKFCAELVESVAAHPDGGAFISQLTELNLLVISLDENARWFRFHDLFRDWLLERATHDKGIDIAVLRRRAGTWFEAQGMLHEALDQVLPIQEWHWASRLCGQLSVDLIKFHEIVVIEMLLNHFPDGFIETQPKLCFLKAMTKSHHNDFNTALKFLEIGKAQLTKAQISEDEQLRRSLGLTTSDDVSEMVAFSFCYHAIMAKIQGNTVQYQDLTKQVLGLPGVEVSPIYVCILYTQGVEHYCQNEFKRAEVLLENAIDHAKSFENPYFLTRSLVLLIATLNHLGKDYSIESKLKDVEDFFESKDIKITVVDYFLKVAKALHHLVKGEPGESYDIMQEIEQELGHLSPIDQIDIKYIKLIAFSAKKNYREASNTLEDIDVIYRRYFTNWSFPSLDVEAYRALIEIWRGNQESLINWSKTFDSEQCDLCPFALEEHISLDLLAQLLDGQDIREKAKLYKQRAEQSGSVVRVIRGWMFEAVYYGLHGHKIRAMKAFKKALKLSASHESIVVLLEGGESNLPFLEAAIKLGIEPSFAHKILQKIKESSLSKPTAMNDASLSDDVNQLTSRELEMLKLMNEGYSNKEIAALASISVGTVKTHLRNLYSKLYVKNRTQALAVARDRGVFEQESVS